MLSFHSCCASARSEACCVSLQGKLIAGAVRSVALQSVIEHRMAVCMLSAGWQTCALKQAQQEYGILRQGLASCRHTAHDLPGSKDGLKS